MRAFHLAVLIVFSLFTPVTFGQPTNPTNAFDRLDANRDGFVDRQEFERAAVAQRNPDLFDELDADKDGKVSREESNRIRGGRPQGLQDLPPPRESPVPEIPNPERPGEPALKNHGDFDAVRDAAGRGQMFEAVIVRFVQQPDL